MESFAFPDKIDSISTEIPPKCSKFIFISLDSLEYFLHFGLVLNGKCLNQKVKPHKQSLVVGDQNGMGFLGLCHFVSKEFHHNNLTLIALYYGKIAEISPLLTKSAF